MDDFARKYFNDHAAELAKQYNAIDRAKVHTDLLGILPQNRMLKILDIGGGSGADAVMFAKLGHHVTVSEPAVKLQMLGQEMTADLQVVWNLDSLPAMGLDTDKAAPFDVITSVGVLQYMDQPQRLESLQKMFSLIAQDGWIQIQYPTPASREGQYTVTQNEISDAMNAFNAENSRTSIGFILDKNILDFTGRKALDGSDLYFRTVILQNAPK